MALSQPRSIYGIDSIAFYNRTTGEFYGPCLRVLGGSELSFSSELIKLEGGSSLWPWGSSNGSINAEISVTSREYPDYLFEILMGADVTTSVISDGSVSTAANKYGTSVINATTGIASVTKTAGDEADLKTGKYVIKATAAGTADVFVSSTIDTAGSLISTDLMKIGAIDISSTNAVLADFGLTFTKGSGTIAMTVGHTATFEVINSKATALSEIVVGSSSASFVEFGAIVYAQKQGEAEIVEFDFPKVKAAGMPVVLKEKAYSEYSFSCTCSYDSSRNRVYTARMIK